MHDRKNMPLHITHTSYKYIQEYSVIIVKSIYLLCYSRGLPSSGALDEGEGDCVCGKDWLGTCSVFARACVCLCGVCDGCTVMSHGGRNIGERWLISDT